MLGIHGSAPTYATPALLEVFSDAGFVEAVRQYEHALLQVQEDLGLVPAGEAAKLASGQAIDLAAAAESAMATSNPVAGVIGQMQQLSPYAHLGVTSHDAWDVAHVLQLRSAGRLILSDAGNAIEQLCTLVETHAETPMLARTQGQAGAPTTLGFKLATWLDELVRSADRLQRALDAAAVLTIAGVVGTASSFAVLGVEPEEVETRLARVLGLETTDTPWFTSRDRFVELAAALGQLCTLAGKVGHEVQTLQRTGIEELAEGGGFGSLANPQKTNPWLSQKMHGLAVIGRNLCALVADSAGLPEGEREIGTAYAEAYGLAQLCMVSGRLAADLADLLRRLQVNEERMRANLESDPAFFSESLSMVLSRAVGKKDGHALMKAAVQRHRAGADFAVAVKEAFRQAGVEPPADLLALPGALSWAPRRSREVAARARAWLRGSR